jgi:hypothetical protein
LPTIQKAFRLEEAEVRTFEAFADRHGFSSVDAFKTLIAAIPLVEAELQKTTEQAPKEPVPSDDKTGAAGLSDSPFSRDPPSQAKKEVMPAAPDPIPLEASSSLKQTASTAISKTSDSGLSVGDSSKAISTPLLEKLRYQQLKAELWQRTRLETEKGIQAIREQVKRYHESDGRRARVEMAPDKGKADCGAPDFYEYERN